MPRPTKGAPKTKVVKTKAKVKQEEPKVKGTRSKTKPTAKAEEPKPLPNPLEGLVGDNVYYYLEGWRCGRLVELTKHCARVRPIVSKYSAEPNCIKIPFDCVKSLA